MAKYNKRHLTPAQCERVRQIKRSTEATMKQLANRFDVCIDTIREVLNGSYISQD